MISLDLLAYIREFIREHGYPPTLRQMAREFGMRSPNGAKYHLLQLESDGYIERDEFAARGIRVTDRGRRVHV